VISAPATSLTSVLGGISNTEAEAGSAIFSILFAAVPLTLIAAVWRRVLVSFGGQATEATVTGIERSTARTVKSHIKFPASDGREINVTLSMPSRVHVGDTMHIRYDPARPEVATDLTARASAIRILPLFAFAAVGLVGVVGTFWSTGTGTFTGFSNGYVIMVLVAFAVVSFFGAYVRYADVKATQPVTGRSLKAGNVLGPTSAGLILVGFAILFAAVFYG
jgi:hypothetical protein